MASIEVGKSFSPGQRERSDLRAARLLFCAAYPFCLAMAVGQRLTAKARMQSRSGTSRRSVFGEARASAASIIPFALR
jgi:hypothetical protein